VSHVAAPIYRSIGPFGSPERLDVVERQRIVRLLVKKILVGDDAITIRHSISVANNPPVSQEPPKSSRFGTPKGEGYLLRSGRENTTLRGAFHPLKEGNIRTFDRGTQPPTNVQTDPGKVGVVRHGFFGPIMWNGIKGKHDRLPIPRISQNQW
jgi:hypothetical protein